MIKLITAYDKNKLIGKEGHLPWNIPEELEHFKQTTLNQTLVIGDVTFNGMGKPLPNRKTIILTLDKSFKYDHKDVIVCYDMNEIIKKFSGNKNEDVFICGGATIYKIFLPFVDELIITHIKHEYEGDSYFPDWEMDLYQNYFTKEYKEFIVKKYKRK